MCIEYVLCRVTVGWRSEIDIWNPCPLYDYSLYYFNWALMPIYGPLLPNTAIVMLISDFWWNTTNCSISTPMCPVVSLPPWMGHSEA